MPGIVQRALINSGSTLDLPLDAALAPLKPYHLTQLSLQTRITPVGKEIAFFSLLLMKNLAAYYESKLRKS